MNIETNKYEVEIGKNQSFSFYLNSYAKSIQGLYDQIESGKTEPIEASMPLMFIIRHFLEIGYKGNINHLSQYSGINDCVDNTKHELTKLHVALKTHYDRVSETLSLEILKNEEFLRLYTNIDELKNFFSEIDSGSFAFRYPFDTKGNYTFSVEQKINIKTTFDSFVKIKGLLLYLGDFVIGNKPFIKEDNDWVIQGGFWNDYGVWNDNKAWFEGI